MNIFNNVYFGKMGVVGTKIWHILLDYNMAAFYFYQILLKFNFHDKFQYIQGKTPPKWMYLLEGRTIVAQASPTRWMFWEPICCSVPVGVVVRGCIQLQWICCEFSTHLPISYWWVMGAPAHTMLCVQQFPTKNDMIPRSHHPYSPDLALSNFFMFSQMENVPKGKRFADREEVKQRMADALKGIKIDEIKNCFEQWRKHFSKCIASNGEYF